MTQVQLEITRMVVFVLTWISFSALVSITLILLMFGHMHLLDRVRLRLRARRERKNLELLAMLIADDAINRSISNALPEAKKPTKKHGNLLRSWWHR